MKKIFHKQSKIANKKRTKEQVKQRRIKFLIRFMKTPIICIKGGKTKSGKSFTAFYY